MRKSLALKIESDEPQVIRIEAKGETVVTAGDIKTNSDVEISGIYIQDVYPIKNGKKIEYYALALINRNEAGNHYKSKIKELTSVIDQQIIEAYKNMGTFASYSVLSKATDLAKENDYYLDILAVINPDFYKISIPDYGRWQTGENCFCRRFYYGDFYASTYRCG